jgi:hypothetical protein
MLFRFAQVGTEQNAEQFPGRRTSIFAAGKTTMFLNGFAIVFCTQVELSTYAVRCMM